MSNQKTPPDYDACSPIRRLPPSRGQIGDGACNGILIGWAVGVIALIVVGVFCPVLGVTSGDGMTRTLALVGFIVFPIFTVVGGLAGAFHVKHRRPPSKHRQPE